MSRAIEKLLLLFGLCSRLREAFGMGSGFVNMEVYVIVPIKSQLSPIIFPQSCELDGRRMGEGWEMKGKERG